MTLPKLILWKLWLERNSQIFRNQSSTPAHVSVKAKALLDDCLTHLCPNTLPQTYSSPEDEWLLSFAPDLKYAPPLPIPHELWEVRKQREDFKEWRRIQHKHILFFDGASKGNLGATGGGGVIYDPTKFRELVYSWGLGEETNNIAEALSLWQGLIQARKLAIQDIMVIGDSRILIQALATNTLPNQMNLRKITKKILWLSHSFHKIDFFHVLRQLNSEADQAAKATTPLSKGQLSINGLLLFDPLP
jgi:ribonuclease HI